MRRRMRTWAIPSHASTITCGRSLRVVSCPIRASTDCFNLSQRCSMGFKSGDAGGHSILKTPSSCINSMHRRCWAAIDNRGGYTPYWTNPTCCLCLKYWSIKLMTKGITHFAWVQGRYFEPQCKVVRNEQVPPHNQPSCVHWCATLSAQILLATCVSMIRLNRHNYHVYAHKSLKFKHIF